MAARLLPTVFSPDRSHFQTPAAPSPEASRTDLKGQSRSGSQSSGPSHVPASLPSTCPHPGHSRLPVKGFDLMPATSACETSQYCLPPLPSRQASPSLWSVPSGFQQVLGILPSKRRVFHVSLTTDSSFGPRAQPGALHTVGA